MSISVAKEKQKHMARKTLNRKELRQESEAAERRAADEPAAPKKKKKAKRKSRAKVAQEVRKKAFWGVVNQSLKCVARFEFSDKDSADKKAEELSVSQKTPHFVKPMKEEIVE